MPSVAEVRAAYEACGRNQTKTAERIGCSRWAVQQALKGFIPQVDKPNPLQSINDNLRLELDRTRDELNQAKEALANAVRPKFTLRQDVAGETETIRVVVIGDAHDDPEIPDKSRFEWAGKYCADTKPDVLLSIGDFLNMNSLCFHIPDENYSGKAKPTYLADIASGREAFAAINSGLGNWNPEKHVTVGNHENRLYRMEDQSPSSMGMYTALYDELLTNAGFTYSPYGETHLIGGVGFTHIPLGIMGKPSSARHLNNIGNDSVRDLVFGHRHRATAQPFPKIGGITVTLVDSGCFLPWGYKKMESFAEHTPGEWTYCLTDLRIKNRRIVDCNFISMLTLEERYG